MARARGKLGVMWIAVVLGMASLTGSGGPAEAAGAVCGPGVQLWEARHNGPGNSRDSATSLTMSPDGVRVYVTGASTGTGFDYATLAYDSVTGEELWAARYDGPGSGGDQAHGLAVSPDGARVYVTGGSYGAGTDYDYATLAYDAATGAPLWEARHNGPGGLSDVANSVAVSPDGTGVFVTGSTTSSGSDPDYATVAYDASSGAPLWVARYEGPADGDDRAYGLAASPNGVRVFVTGRSYSSDTYSDYATVAYDAASGVELWERRYSGPRTGYDVADALVVGPGGSRVFVTGRSEGPAGGSDYATLAYSAGGPFPAAQAYALRAVVPGQDTGQVMHVAAEGGGPAEQRRLAAQYVAGVADVEIGHTAAWGGGGDTDGWAGASSTLGRVSLLGGLVSATEVRASAYAIFSCADGGGVGSWGSSFGTVQVAGINHQDPVAPNTRIEIPGVGTLVLREQIREETDTSARITVNMIHFASDDGAQDVVIGSATASVTASG
ncbi:MAG: PQQ-binding-like beta-propeller repeat protein [Acidobacteria bacterium]|nr:PQQ-binding-like beta-propeller repeat protein [Acidobacteriota bacterium]